MIRTVTLTFLVLLLLCGTFVFGQDNTSAQNEASENAPQNDSQAGNSNQGEEPETLDPFPIAGKHSSFEVLQIVLNKADAQPSTELKIYCSPYQTWSYCIAPLDAYTIHCYSLRNRQVRLSVVNRDDDFAVSTVTVDQIDAVLKEKRKVSVYRAIETNEVLFIDVPQEVSEQAYLTARRSYFVHWDTMRQTEGFRHRVHANDSLCRILVNAGISFCDLTRQLGEVEGGVDRDFLNRAHALLMDRILAGFRALKMSDHLVADTNKSNLREMISLIAEQMPVLASRINGIVGSKIAADN